MSIKYSIEKGLLLDTHAWIWLNNGSDELDSKVIRQIDKAAAQGEIFISAISLWEIGVLASKKRMILRTSIHEWIHEALAQPGVHLVTLSTEILIESTQLPDSMHGDPADRMIVATARIRNLTLLTRDEKILSYAKSGYLQAIKI